MSLWTDHGLTDKVNQILRDVPLNNPDGHHFGRPYLSAYQLAIEIERQYPDTYDAIGKDVGGAGSGPHSLAQYLAHQLSQQIRDHGDEHDVEGAFLSNGDVIEYRFRREGGTEVVSSLTGTPFDLSMFRRRQRTQPPD